VWLQDVSRPDVYIALIGKRFVCYGHCFALFVSSLSLIVVMFTTAGVIGSLLQCMVAVIVCFAGAQDCLAVSVLVTESYRSSSKHT